jgi:hypothetical protein
MTYMTLYDADNHAVVQSKPLKLTLNPSALTTTNWQLNVAALQPGVYRVDVSLQDELVWRGFFRVTP